MIKYLLTNGADPNACNNDGSTPLHMLSLCPAALQRDEHSTNSVMTMVFALLQSGANPSIPNNRNKFPFHYFSSEKVHDHLKSITHHVTIMVNEDCLHEILGRHWSNATILQSKYHVVIEYVRTPEKAGKKKLTFWGTIIAVEECLRAIEAVTKELVKSSALLENESYAVSLEIPKEYHMYIVGVNGATAKSFRQKYKVRLFIPTKESADTEIKIAGRKDHVQACMKHMMEIIEHNTKSKKDTVQHNTGDQLEFKCTQQTMLEKAKAKSNGVEGLPQMQQGLDFYPQFNGIFLKEEFYNQDLPLLTDDSLYFDPFSEQMNEVDMITGSTKLQLPPMPHTEPIVDDANPEKKIPHKKTIPELEEEIRETKEKLAELERLLAQAKEEKAKEEGKEAKEPQNPVKKVVITRIKRNR